MNRLYGPGGELFKLLMPKRLAVVGGKRLIVCARNISDSINKQDFCICCKQLLHGTSNHLKTGTVYKFYHKCCFRCGDNQSSADIGMTWRRDIRGLEQVFADQR